MGEQDISPQLDKIIDALGEILTAIKELKK